MPAPLDQPTPDSDPKRRPPRAWPGVALGLALAWVVVARVPLVVNARAHLDSDLAVDGLVLIEATRGQFRWHYPGTPPIGSIPVVLSLGQALAVGPSPAALVSGGVVAFGLLVGACWWLNRRAFGPSVATWGLVPLAFGSTGMIWLSGRITGGHLMAAAWTAAAFALLAGGWRRGGRPRRWAGLGLWCGLGVYLDLMFLAALAGLAVAVLVGGWWGADRPRSARRAGAGLVAFGLGLMIGLVPLVAGRVLDPHDSYAGQLRPVFDYDTVVDHNLWLLLLDCEPRLLAGHRLPGLEVDPTSLPDGSRPTFRPVDPAMIAATVLPLGLFAWGLLRLIKGRVVVPPGDGGTRGLPPLRARAIGWGLVASGLAVSAEFVTLGNIANSDNFRYLVLVLVPWSAGFGVLFTRWAAGGRVARGLAVALAVVFAGTMTLDVARWYGRLGWVDGSGWRPVRVVPDDPALDWLDAHPEVTSIRADYWDAYRLSFLTGGRVAAVPLEVYPNRFPEVARSLPGSGPRTLIARPVPPGFVDERDRPIARARAQALARGGREVGNGPRLSVIDLPPDPRRSAP